MQIRPELPVKHLLSVIALLTTLGHVFRRLNLRQLHRIRQRGGRVLVPVRPRKEKRLEGLRLAWMLEGQTEEWGKGRTDPAPPKMLRLIVSWGISSTSSLRICTSWAIRGFLVRRESVGARSVCKR